MEILSALSRWIHVLAGIVWIGMLYFFNFVNGPFQGTQDGETKKKVNPELLPRALWWFRWGAAWTWLTGVILLMLVFYHGGITFDPDGTWGVAAYVLIAVTFLAPFVYDALHKSPLGKDPKTFGGIAFVLVAVVAFLMARWAGFSYRSLQHPPGGDVRHDHGLERLVRDLAGAAEDPPRGEGRHGSRRGARRTRGRPLTAQHLHVGAARLGHAELAHDVLRRRQPRDSRRVRLRRSSCWWCCSAGTSSGSSTSGPGR